nr:chemosensory protein 4 [Pachyrhinus yasumatsui]
MHKFFLLFLAVQIFVCFAQQYTSKYDNLDINKILSNDRVLTNYVKCILDAGPCTSEGRELKTHIPEALSTSCAKCTESQKKFVRMGANYLIKNKPNEWGKIAKKYDPEGEHSAQFNEFLKG